MKKTIARIACMGQDVELNEATQYRIAQLQSLAPAGTPIVKTATGGPAIAQQFTNSITARYFATRENN
jgi:hypothetical protein